MLYKVLQKILKLFLNIYFKIDIYNLCDNELNNNKCIICCNHISMFDPVVLGVFYDRQIYFMAKKELFSNKILASFLNKLGVISVDRKGLTLSAIKNALRLLNNNCVLGIFPEGTRVKDFDINNVKPGIAMLAYKSKSPVLPVFIDADYKFRGNIKIYFGKPKYYFDDCEDKPDNKTYINISKDILNDIYSLNKR